jgi:hypothetical protein
VVLLGYSNGAYAVTNLVHDFAKTPPPERIAGVILFGAETTLRADEVRALGARVGFTAADNDGAGRAIRANASELRRQGIETCFVSLGNAGHFIPQSTSAPIARLVDWARNGGVCPGR